MYIYNARICTLDAQTPLVSALAIHHDRITTIGDDQSIQAEFGEQMEGLDLNGRVVIPGLTDSHIHLEYFALNHQKVDCQVPEYSKCLERVAERARITPPGEWILGHGWNQNDWREGFGSASDLDAVAPANPVYLTAKSLHAGWANSAALQLANLDTRTPDPPAGRLGRKESGEPNGILFESAMELVAQVIPQPTAEQVAQAIREAQPTLWRLGLTGVHDFDRRRCFLALQALQAGGELRLRVLKSIPLEDLPYAVGLGLGFGFGDEYLRIGGVKIFADGAFGPHTAAMFQPFQDEPENLGMLFLDAEELAEHGRLAVEVGLPLAVHAIGDRANHEVLNAIASLRDYEIELLQKKGAPDDPRLRHRIEHVQVIHPQDAGRLAELGVIASMQPSHATSDMDMAERLMGERASQAYAFRTQLERGAMLAFGSDAPVESPDPFLGLHAAVTRRTTEGSPGPQGWYGEQRLNVGQALQAYTLGAAYAAGREHHLGRLAPGFLADLVVLDSDPFKCAPEDLYRIRPLATMVGGSWVFREGI